MRLSEIADEVADLNDLLWVKSDRGLVEDDDGRVSDECLRDADSLAVALGEILDKTLLYVVDLRYLADFLEVELAIESALFYIVYEV